MAPLKSSPIRLLSVLRHSQRQHSSLSQQPPSIMSSTITSTTTMQPMPMSRSYRFHSTTTPPKRPLPPGTWDSHMHIVSPDTTRYPLAGSANYTPTPHTLDDMHDFYWPLHLQRPVFVQPSPYGTDNSLILDALAATDGATGHACGVVVIDPHTTSPETLQEWHAQGVRAARVNLVSVNATPTPAELQATLEAYATLLRPLDWALQLYVPLALCDVLEPLVPQLGIRVVVDHFGSPPRRTLDSDAAAGASSPRNKYDEPATSLPGFAALVRLLEAGSTWVKISGWYRLVERPEDMDVVAKALIGARSGTRGVWASDWPHTRFEGVDVGPFVDACWRWCDELSGGRDEGTAYAERLFRGNAEELWGVKGS